jgi:nitrogen fixation-related uncharacterized protein
MRRWFRLSNLVPVAIIAAVVVFFFAVDSRDDGDRARR